MLFAPRGRRRPDRRPTPGRGPVCHREEEPTRSRIPSWALPAPRSTNRSTRFLRLAIGWADLVGVPVVVLPDLLVERRRGHAAGASILGDEDVGPTAHRGKFHALDADLVGEIQRAFGQLAKILGDHAIDDPVLDHLKALGEGVDADDRELPRLD